MRSLIAGNWKMNGLRGDGRERAEALRKRVAGAEVCDVLICPPATLLSELAGVLDGSAVALGAQDCHVSASGAFTGDLAAPMLADIGCSHVIVGHSERRRDNREGDADVAAKASAAHDAGLTAIICIGESAEERDGGRALDVVRGQLEGSLPAGATSANTVVAYEPVWAIGTGNTATPNDVAAMHDALRAALVERLGNEQGGGIRLLYGGSVNADNVAELLAVPHVNGTLVGGASLKVDAFWTIVENGATS
ncbi:MAG: triose-phosphate isomerase [Rhodospirillales bacterium]|nr:triose-phosphate isomerase [Rhodospirillales bacterium]